jgi:hypothetical protein
LVPGIAKDEWDARGDRSAESSRKIVEPDDALAGCDERACGPM